MTDDPAGRVGLKPPPPCVVCGALAGEDHAENCNILQAIRAQEYPTLIDRNAHPWYANALRAKDAEIERLRTALAETHAKIDAILRGNHAGWAQALSDIRAALAPATEPPSTETNGE